MTTITRGWGTKIRRAAHSITPVIVVGAGCAAALLITSAAQGTVPPTLYVDGTSTSCSDTGSGTQAQPYCTINKAATVATAGQTVEVASGTYTERVAVNHSGTSDSPIVFRPADGASVTVTGAANGFFISGLINPKSYITIQGFNITGTSSYGIALLNASNITIANNTVTYSGHGVQSQTAAGIYLDGTSNSTITGNTSDHNSSHGIYVHSPSTQTGNLSNFDLIAGNEASFNAEVWQRNATGINVTGPDNTVIGNVVHDNEDSGLQFYKDASATVTGGNNGLATLNVSYNNGDHGIDDLNVTGGRLIGNTVYHNCTSGINVEGTSGNYTVENNVAVDNAVYAAYNGISCNRRAGNIGIWDSAPPTTTVDNNLVNLTTAGTMYSFAGVKYTSLAAMQAATGQEQHGVQANPNFVSTDPGSINLQLTESSPAIDAANSDVSGEQSTDMLNNPRLDDLVVPNTGLGTRAYDDIGAYEFQSNIGAPVAALTAAPDSGSVPFSVTADASTSTDPQGQALSYMFDFGDGAVVGPQSGATATHIYVTPGSHTVTVTATNPWNLSSTAQAAVTVAASAPSAVLTAAPTSGVGMSVTADGSGSTDPQGQPVSYTFDFGDGTVVGPQSGATATHTYGNLGAYTVTLTVTNQWNLTSTAQVTVTPIAPPVAGLAVTPTSGSAPLSVTADASGSTDPQGQGLSYTFNFGDGTVVGPQSGAIASHVYGTPGNYTATVTVKNMSNLTASAQAAIAVGAIAPSAPGNVVAEGYNNAATVTWSAAAKNGGSNIKSYSLWKQQVGVDASPVLVTTVGASTRSYQFIGLASNSDYMFFVTATNTAGVIGPPSPAYTLRAPSITISASASSIRSGQSVTLTGFLTDPSNGQGIGGTVQLYSRKHGTTSWKASTKVTTDASGKYTFTVKPTSSTDYMVVYSSGSTTYMGNSSAVQVITVA
jgi:parallel beta-helix repeat protein